MKNNLRRLIYILLLLVVSYGLALIWWRAWMYHEAIGPIPFMHWIVSSDGEGSYTLTELEMFIHFLVALLSGYFVYSSTSTRRVNR